MMRPALLAVPIITLLAGCATNPPPTAAQTADLSACTQQADARDAAHHFAYLSRTDQFGTPREGAPDQTYVSNKLAQLNDRDQDIRNCVNYGNTQTDSLHSAPLPAPRIIGPAP
jgi:hypothetical protein